MSGKARQNVERLPKHSFPLTVDKTARTVQLKYCSIPSFKMFTVTSVALVLLLLAKKSKEKKCSICIRNQLSDI